MDDKKEALELPDKCPVENDTHPEQIEVSIEEDQAPARIRKLRLQAGLTKSEAARCVGLTAALTWHGYESGRFAMPDWRWKMFLVALKTGLYTRHIRTEADGEARRHGPRAKSTFTPGELHTEKTVAPVVKNGGEILKRARQSARLSPRAIAAEVEEVSASTLYAIESGVRSISGELMSKVRRVLAQRILDLELMRIDVRDERDITPLVGTLRSSQDEVGQHMFPAAHRPGAMISQYAQGTLKLSEDRRIELLGALEAVRTASLLAASVSICEIDRALALTSESTGHAA